MSALGKDKEVGLEGGAAGPSARLRAVTLRRAGLALALWGEPGVGKTHLAGRLLREAGCRSYSFHATVPLGTLLATLPRPVGRAALPAWAEGLLERLAAGASVPPEQAADALVALLAALAPLVLFFEDLHEADVVRGELIQSLARRAVRTRGVGLLATTRAEPPEVFEGYRLERLSPEGTCSMLEGEIGGALPEQAHRWIYQHAAGNPLFSLEYLRLLARQGFLWSDGRRWNWREPSGPVVPVTVEALLESMIGEAKADDKVRSALEAKAILPKEADSRLWVTVSGLDEAALEESEARLEAQGLLRGGDFAHPLFREYSAALTAPGRRKTLARRALQALCSTNLQAAAAFVVQADLPPEEAYRLLTEAAQAAEKSGDPIQASRWKLEAVAVAPLELRAALALEAAEGYRTHSLEQAAEAARAALGAEPDNVEALFLLAELLALRGLQSEADAALKRLPARLRESPAWLMRQLMVRSALEDHAGVVRLWDEHPELHRTAPPLNVVATVDAMLYLGRFNEALVLAEQITVRSGLEPLEQALLERALGRAEFYAGRLEASRARFEAVLPVIARHSPGHQTALTLVRLGICHYYAGNFTEALKSLQEGLAEFARLGDGRWCAVAKHYLGSVYAGLGQPDRWEELFLGAYEYLSRLGPSDSLVNVGNALAWAYSHGGTPLNRLLGLKYARNATATARDLGSVRAVLNSGVQLSLALSYTGDARQGLSVAEESLNQLRGLDYPFILALTLEAKGVALAALGQPEPALAAWGEAVRLNQQHSNLEDVDRIHLRSAVLRDDRAAALKLLEESQTAGRHFLLQLARTHFPELLSTAPMAAAQPATGLRLEVLGPPRAGGQAVRGGKRQELLALLLEARLSGRNGVDKLELLDTLYPGEPDERAGAALRDLVRTLRAQLSAPFIETTPTGYALGSGVTADAEEFLKGGETGLWRGPYLEGLSELAHGEEVRESLYLDLHARAESLLESDPTEAARLGRILLTADPYNVSALRLTVYALRKLGNHRSLSRHYSEARERMLEVGEELPSDWQTFLASA